MTFPIDEKIKTKAKRHIKCVIWDLDHTIWNGILMENSEVQLHSHILDVIISLDKRGILQSIASRNEYDIAMEKLKELGIEEYFIYPQINWNNKSSSVQTISNLININMDAIAFIDDQLFEREEVTFHHPQVFCLDAVETVNLLKMSEFSPAFLTKDSINRRQMYLNDIVRKSAEDRFEGQQDEFLYSLDMVLTLSFAEGDDLKRAEELTVRTNQLNATGYTFSYEEIEALSHSPNHKLIICGLDDKFGTYGKVGLALLECNNDCWTLKLLLVSCRVISRGIGAVMLNFIAKLANNAGKILRGEFLPTGRNRMMLLTYKLSGFRELEEREGMLILEHEPSQLQNVPEYITLFDYVS
ncbi:MULTISPECIES: HAD-IIIC family phosphatase [Paenibacillus]|uniref:HAD-IIIC family phosphatase n=1 Tax=Paenibacillus cucumis (ex Kampfer et al. 2016) TaxID=1776858 RepID=A0ABS7KSH8_9BACL|nr:HAD-IIIC family phosphatase [Paenibacillus cucumis (ex Kampfer et al. 2016)]MBY0207124.1 HAD-IIIC family phosphatase [Paenibacillus cucumis (ex Kampfer et al. 2016)]MDP9698975.1 FkbH-like protein [Paenibacillus intestini]